MGGVHQIAARLAENLMSAPKLGEPVLSIEQDENGIAVRTTKERYEAELSRLREPACDDQRTEGDGAWPE